ncbi:hypothetical protein NDU88_000846 [Pleurodeles waltl]|uniref:Uncharacterized protein n=1 Tax=Pleurodeles waltl TaxID=8319 RepID=A0AAV7P3P2_PLEWA|nr:hypothetical protein NDU88_000846 [Pleurodeles waltl]
MGRCGCHLRRLRTSAGVKGEEREFFTIAPFSPSPRLFELMRTLGDVYKIAPPSASPLEVRGKFRSMTIRFLASRNE